MFLNIEDDHGIVTGCLGVPAQQLPERPAQLVESYYVSS
jgi:hypothetical protein